MLYIIDDVNVVKCEPWNSVKITFDLPAEAAEKLSELAKAGDNNALREMGILSLQIQGGQVSLKLMQDLRTNFDNLIFFLDHIDDHDVRRRA